MSDRREEVGAQPRAYPTPEEVPWEEVLYCGPTENFPGCVIAADMYGYYRDENGFLRNIDEPDKPSYWWGALNESDIGISGKAPDDYGSALVARWYDQNLTAKSVGQVLIAGCNTNGGRFPTAAKLYRIPAGTIDKKTGTEFSGLALVSADNKAFNLNPSDVEKLNDAERPRVRKTGLVNYRRAALKSRLLDTAVILCPGCLEPSLAGPDELKSGTRVFKNGKTEITLPHAR